VPVINGIDIGEQQRAIARARLAELREREEREAYELSA